MRHLGCIPSRHDDRTLVMARYFDVSNLPAPPPSRDWTNGDQAPAWGRFGNDDEGDCAFASIGHVIQATSALTHQPSSTRRIDVEDAYSKVTGWDPARPETDRGTDLLDAMNYWRTDGIGGQKIEAFATVDPQHGGLIEAVLNEFGPVIVHLALPLAWQTATVWDVAPPNEHSADYAPASWGHHATALLALDRRHATVITWGQPKILTREALISYCRGVFVPLGHLWVGENGRSPSGFDVAAMRRDLAIITR